jgi:Mg2+ and Co2+ transporter CorA
MLRRLSALLSEAVMGFLALAALGAGLAPLLFELSSTIEGVLDAVEWAIVAAFALEYVVHLLESRDRAAFVRDPWRILDAAIVAGSVASLMPVVSDAARSMPALRILRLFRAILFGVRAGHGVSVPAVPPGRSLPQGPPQVTRLSENDSAMRLADWAALLQWAASPTHDWIHASNLPSQRLREAAEAAGVAHVLVEAALNESSYPRLEAGARWSALTLSVPTADDPPRRDPVLLLVAEHDMLSLAPFPIEVQRPPDTRGGSTWGGRCALEVVRQVIARNEELAGRLEHGVRELEMLPADESPDRFFEATFRLKRALSVARSDLWRLKGVLEMVAEGRRSLPGLDEEGRELARRLAEEADYLYETVDNARESVLSLIDLHINVAAHGTNRFMRLVAIMSTLGLIPAIIGGLLGMNLIEAPWSLTLGQVAFVTLLLMLGILYTFLAKGWLK